MSYCVNCGVKLDPSLKRCPLCNTPVVNPNDLAAIQQPVPPFPQEKGQVEVAAARIWRSFCPRPSSPQAWSAGF